MMDIDTTKKKKNPSQLKVLRQMQKGNSRLQKLKLS